MLVQRITVHYLAGKMDTALALLKAERSRLEQENDPHNLGKSRPRLMTPWHVADTSIAEYEFESIDDMRATWARWEASEAGKAFLQAYAPLIEPGMTTDLFDLSPGQPPRDTLKPGSFIQRLTVRYKVGASQDVLQMLVAESQRCRKEGFSFMGDARFYAPWRVADTSVGDFVFANLGEIDQAWDAWGANAGTRDFMKDYAPLMMSGFQGEINKVL